MASKEKVQEAARNTTAGPLAERSSAAQWTDPGCTVAACRPGALRCSTLQTNCLCLPNHNCKADSAACAPQPAIVQPL